MLSIKSQFKFLKFIFVFSFGLPLANAVTDSYAHQRIEELEKRIEALEEKTGISQAKLRVVVAKGSVLYVAAKTCAEMKPATYKIHGGIVIGGWYRFFDNNPETRTYTMNYTEEAIVLKTLECDEGDYFLIKAEGEPRYVKASDCIET